MWAGSGRANCASLPCTTPPHLPTHDYTLAPKVRTCPSSSQAPSHASSCVVRSVVTKPRHHLRLNPTLPRLHRYHHKPRPHPHPHLTPPPTHPWPAPPAATAPPAAHTPARLREEEEEGGEGEEGREMRGGEGRCWALEGRGVCATLRLSNWSCRPLPHPSSPSPFPFLPLPLPPLPPPPHPSPPPTRCGQVQRCEAGAVHAHPHRAQRVEQAAADQ